MGYSEEIGREDSNSVAFFCKDIYIQKALEKVCLALGSFKKNDIEFIYYRNSGPENFNISWPTARLINSESLDRFLALIIDSNDLEAQLLFISSFILIGELRAEDFSGVGVVEPFLSKLDRQIPTWLKDNVTLLPLEISEIIHFLSSKPNQKGFVSNNLEKAQALYLACISRLTHSLKNGDYLGGPYFYLDFPFFKKALINMERDVEKLKIFVLSKLINKTLDLMQEKDLDIIKNRLIDINDSWNKVYIKCTRIRGKIFKEICWEDIVDDLKELQKIFKCL